MKATVSTRRLEGTEPVGSTRLGGKYLIFQIGKEEFGMNVLQVREIMGLQEITTVPQMPPHVKGIMNLRGRVIPVIDLRLRFGLDPDDYTSRTCIIVVRTRQAGQEVTVGTIVDSVAEVLTLASSEVEDPPDFGVAAVTPYLLGLAKTKGQVRILLDVDQVLDTTGIYGIGELLQ